jgi:hypothetical protein
VHHYQPALLQLADVEPVTTLTSQAQRSAALDDSLDFSYGKPQMDAQQYSAMLENEKKNFRLLISKVGIFKSLLFRIPDPTIVSSRIRI